MGIVNMCFAVHVANQPKADRSCSLIATPLFMFRKMRHLRKPTAHVVIELPQMKSTSSPRPSMRRALLLIDCTLHLSSLVAMHQDSEIGLTNDAAILCGTSSVVGPTKLARSQGCQRPMHMLNRQRVLQWSAARLVNDRYSCWSCWVRHLVRTGACTWQWRHLSQQALKLRHWLLANRKHAKV